MNAETHSSSDLLTALLFGTQKKGKALGPREALFGDYVVALTAVGTPRMPNGIECTVTIPARSGRIVIGDGRLCIGHFDIAAGRPWDPIPKLRPMEVLPPGPVPQLSALSTWVGAAPVRGDALLAGYIAGLVLLHSHPQRAADLARHAAAESPPVTATALRHAARGEVPEPVHRLLAAGDASALMNWGATGMLWLRGLVSAGYPFAAATPPRAPARRTIASRAG